jgi:hypothetical protein
VGRGVHQVPVREGRSGRRSESGHDLVDWEFERIVVTGKGEPLWAADGKYLTEWWVGGPAFYVEVQEER